MSDHLTPCTNDNLKITQLLTWHDLGVEKALRLRVRRLGMRGSRELVLGLPGHTKLGSDLKYGVEWVEWLGS